MTELEKQKAAELRREADDVWAEAVKCEHSNPALSEWLKDKSTQLHAQAALMEEIAEATDSQKQ